MYPLVLSLTLSGFPQRWLTVFEAAQYVASDRVAWSFGETSVVLKGGMNGQGLQSALEIPAILATRGDRRGRKNATPPLNRRNLFARDQYMCLYCGVEFPFYGLSIDHIIPRSKGGQHRFTNAATACLRCNQHKADRDPEEAGMTLLSVPYTPNRYEYLFLKNRRILADQMDYLKKGFSNLAA